jgi:hypothetical protein
LLVFAFFNIFSKNSEINSDVKTVMSSLGALSAFAIMVLAPTGIVLLLRGRDQKFLVGPFDERSGNGEASVIPPELGNWNWGAALMSFWWGIYHRVWLTFLSFIPVFGGIWWIVMGIKGNEWAWRKNKWRSVGAFKASQKKWAVWGIILSVVPIILVFVIAVFGAAFISLALRSKNNQPITISDFYFENKNAAPVIGYPNAIYEINGEMIAVAGGANIGAGIKADSKSGIMHRDINGDGTEDAVFILTSSSGGSGTFYYLVAAVKDKIMFVGTNAVFLGDRVSVTGISWTNGMIEVKYKTRRPEDAMTDAPTVQQTDYFIYSAGRLVPAK